MSVSKEMVSLLEHQKEIKNWKIKVSKRIYELEEQYLEETLAGNIIKGWDIEGREKMIKRSTFEEKERLFSFSSYTTWNDCQRGINPSKTKQIEIGNNSNNSSNNSGGKQQLIKHPTSSTQPKKKKRSSTSSNNLASLSQIDDEEMIN
jgi:hypothetical protein